MRPEGIEPASSLLTSSFCSWCTPSLSALSCAWWELLFWYIRGTTWEHELETGSFLHHCSWGAGAQLSLAPQEGASPAPKDSTIGCRTRLQAVSVLNHWIWTITCFFPGSQGKWTPCFEVVLTAFPNCFDFISGPTALSAYLPFLISRRSPLPWMLQLWPVCFLTAYFFFSEISYFSCYLKTSAADGVFPFAPCQLPAQPSWQRVQAVHGAGLPPSCSIPWSRVLLTITTSNGKHRLAQRAAFICPGWDIWRLFKSALRQCKPTPIHADLIRSSPFYSRFTKFFWKKRRKTSGLTSVIKLLQVPVEQPDCSCSFAWVSNSLYFSEKYFVPFLTFSLNKRQNIDHLLNVVQFETFVFSNWVER